jgi:hypothetical protein
MTCHDARELFSAHLDDALPASERVALDAHLVGCAECRRELERLRGTVALLHAVEPARAPAGFVDRVLAAARPAPWYRRLARAVLLPWRVKLPLEAAAIVLVGVAVALVWRTPEMQRTPRVAAPTGVSETPLRDVQPAMPPPPAAAPARPATPSPLAQSELPRVAAQPAPAAEPKARNKAAEVEAPKSLYAPAPTGPREESAPKRDAEERVLGIRRTLPGARPPDVKSAPGDFPTVAKTAPFAPPRADIAGRLAVGNRDAAERALTQLLARVGGRELGRRAAPGGAVVDLALPRAAFPDFVRGLEAIGRWQPGEVPAELPSEVRVEVRIGD